MLTVNVEKQLINENNITSSEHAFGDDYLIKTIDGSLILAQKENEQYLPLIYLGKDSYMVNDTVLLIRYDNFISGHGKSGALYSTINNRYITPIFNYLDKSDNSNLFNFQMDVQGELVYGQVTPFGLGYEIQDGEENYYLINERLSLLNMEKLALTKKKD